MSTGMITLLVALVAAVSAVGSAFITGQSSRKVAAEEAAQGTLDKASEALEEAWAQRLLYRDEQLEGLRKQLTDAVDQIEKLSAEVQRLSKLVISLGGVPHE